LRDFFHSVSAWWLLFTKPARPRADQGDVTWFDPTRLDDPSPFLIGALELPLGSLTLGLRLERFNEESPSVGVWTDEWGQFWAVEEAGQA
jgi:hypothetical protein